MQLDDGRSGQRFCLFHPAQGEKLRGSIVYIHPFAEEMNKSRRMAALQARAFSHAGYEVLQIDLLGCGDSSGDFGAATWDDWVSDVVQACRWMRRRSNRQDSDADEVPMWLWGLRAGCLIAVEAAGRLDTPCNFLFWQPPASGKPLLQQFLRLKAAGSIMDGQTKGLMETMRRQLGNGAPVEIAGYLLSSGLATGLGSAILAPPAGMGRPRNLVWLELSTREDAVFGPSSIQAVAKWQQSGFVTHAQLVNGPAFWQTSEIEEAPALIAATTAAISA